MTYEKESPEGSTYIVKAIIMKHLRGNHGDQ